MRIYNLLEQALRKEPNYITDDGHLKKWVVISKAQNFDEELLTLLIDEPELKAEFFKEIHQHWVFDQNRFVQFLEQKNFLNDSYTAFKNKIGLTIDGKYLKQRNEVALVWPFKDCVLEGGQSREEDKREEIFFNETLAQDEITQLLEPKVLTNGKRINPEGEKSLDQFNRDEKGNIKDSLIIKGNNFMALHTLKKEFSKQVKLIYIDPPYNTGSDGFEYNDSFNHSSWLTFIKNRLTIARDLLKIDGTIAISIDHNELGYLIIVMDEIFGKENLKNIITIKRGSVTGAKVINPGVVNISEYLVIYSRDASKWKPNRVFRQKGRDDRYNKFIESYEAGADKWNFVSLLDKFCENKGIAKSKLKKELGENYEPELENFVIVNQDRVIRFASLDDKAISQIALETKKLSLENPDTIYTVEREDKRDYLIYNGELILFAKDRLTEVDGIQRFGELITDIWDDVLPNDLHNEGNVTLRKGKKPEKLIARIIELCTDENDLVLDFFVGSGTTGSVCLKTKRQFIVCEQLEYTETLPFRRIENTIRGEQSGVSKSYNWQGGGSFVYLELKKYNQTFVEQIAEASSTEVLLEIWEAMKAKSFLNYNVDIKKQEAHIEEFKALTLAEQKRHLVEILDKNQLYVNLSSLDDDDFAVTDHEKKITKAFYQKQAKK